MPPVAARPDPFASLRPAPTRTASHAAGAADHGGPATLQAAQSCSSSSSGLSTPDSLEAFYDAPSRHATRPSSAHEAIDLPVGLPVELPVGVHAWHRSAPLFSRRGLQAGSREQLLQVEVPRRGRTLSEANALFVQGCLLAAAFGSVTVALVLTADPLAINWNDPQTMLRLNTSLLLGCASGAVAALYAWQASGLGEIRQLRAEVTAQASLPPQSPAV